MSITYLYSTTYNTRSATIIFQFSPSFLQVWLSLGHAVCGHHDGSLLGAGAPLVCGSHSSVSRSRRLSQGHPRNLCLKPISKNTYSYIIICLQMETETSAPGETPQFLGVREQRVTGVMVFLLTGLSVKLAPILKVYRNITTLCHQNILYLKTFTVA